MFTMAQNWNRPAESVFAISDPAATMATGPDSWPATPKKFVTMLFRPPRTVEDSLINSVLAMLTTSPKSFARTCLMTAFELRRTPMRPAPSGPISGVTLMSRLSLKPDPSPLPLPLLLASKANRAAAEVEGTSSLPTRLGAERSTVKTMGREGLARIRSTTWLTSPTSEPMSVSPTRMMISPPCKPDWAARLVGARDGIFTPGRKEVSALPMRLIWTRSVRYAKMTLAITPALMTAARDKMERFWSKLGSSAL
mmetsp:Transcript_17353/g.48126  ORF Transcript_17353/g.48126 Transcript_17353/m.48126 type:complete len:253 (+) Transcript_17353:793-1551(+)